MQQTRRRTGQDGGEKKAGRLLGVKGAGRLATSTSKCSSWTAVASRFMSTMPILVTANGDPSRHQQSIVTSW